MAHAVVTVLVAIVFSTLVLLLATPAFIVLGLVERYGPVRGARPSLKAQVRGFLFQVVGVIAGSITMAFVWPWLPAVHPVRPGLALPLALLLSDCLQYWEHRIEHWLLWRFHAVHHATREMSSTSNVSHFTHQAFMTVLYGLPMGLICGDPMSAIPVIVAVYAWTAVVHSPARIEIGALRLVLTDNRVHRIHHSLELRHHDRNFGSILNIWDRMFGTFYEPRDEWPESGVAGHGEIETVRDVLSRPFIPRAAADHLPAE